MADPQELESVWHSSDGTEHRFPAGVPFDVMKKRVAEYEGKLVTTKRDTDLKDYATALGGGNQPGGSLKDKAIEFARPLGIAPALAAGSEAAAALPLPPVGKALGGALVGTGTYLGLDTLLQRLMDKKPVDLNQSLQNSASNLAVTEGLSAAGRKGYSMLKGAMAEKAVPGSVTGPIHTLEPTYSQYPDAPGASVARKIENLFTPGSKEAAMANSGNLAAEEGTRKAAIIGGRGESIVSNPQEHASLIQQDALQSATPAAPAEIRYNSWSKNFPSQQPEIPKPGEKGFQALVTTTNSPIKEVDAIVNDPKKLQFTLNKGAAPLTNLRGDLGGYKLNQILQESTTVDPLDASKKSINPQALMDKWNDSAFKASKDILYSKATQENISQFFNNVAQTQSGGPGSGFSRIGIVRGTILLTPAFLLHSLTTPGGIAVAGVELGGVGLAKLLTKPETARIMVAAAKGQPLGVSDQYASRLIAGALKGSMVNLVGPDGQKTQAAIDGGQLIPQIPSQ